MSIALADALADVDLEVGQTYRCEVHGRQVELRVRAKPVTSTGLSLVTSPGLSEEDVMLDPWCELPSPPVVGVLSSRLVERLPFDIPEIPADEDEE